MRITQIETFTVVVPVRPGAWHSPAFEPEGYQRGGVFVAMEWPEAPTTILRVHTDSGLIGLGEAHRGISAGAIEAWAPYFVGHELEEFTLQDLPVQGFAGPEAAYDAYEMALYDLTGKLLGLPVHRLFGGAFRTRVPVSWCSGRQTPDDAAATARRAVEQGYRVLKMKATADDPLADRLQAIERAVGDALVVNVDPNQRLYQPYRLIALINQLRDRGIRNVECFESPFNQGNLDWYRLARQQIGTPLALHLGAAGAVAEAVKREACDWLNLGGSMVNFYKTGAIAEAAGIPVWHGSGVGLGISEAAYIHVCAATRACTLTSDIVGEKLRVDDLIIRPLVFHDGVVDVPQDPGLGVDLDMEAIERYGIKPA
jgi:muconate cycloisomerase